MANDKTSKPSVTSALEAPLSSSASAAKEAAAEAVLQTVPTSRLEADIPTQKPRDDNRRSDGGRSIPKVAQPRDERNDGKAVLTGALAEKVAKKSEELASKERKPQPNARPDADRTRLDRQTPALALKALTKALDERPDPPAESYEATEEWVEADLSDEVGLNGRSFKAGRQFVPKALLEAFPMVVKKVKKDKE